MKETQEKFKATSVTKAYEAGYDYEEWSPDRRETTIGFAQALLKIDDYVRKNDRFDSYNQSIGEIVGELGYILTNQRTVDGKFGGQNDAHEVVMSQCPLGYLGLGLGKEFSIKECKTCNKVSKTSIKAQDFINPKMQDFSDPSKIELNNGMPVHVPAMPKLSDILGAYTITETVNCYCSGCSPEINIPHTKRLSYENATSQIGTCIYQPSQNLSVNKQED